MTSATKKNRGYAVSIVNIDPLEMDKKFNKELDQELDRELVEISDRVFSGFPKRNGAKQDSINLQSIIHHLDFECINANYNENLSISDWDHRVKSRFSKAGTTYTSQNCCISCHIQSLNHSNSECFLLAISSHGQEITEPEIFFSDNNTLKLSQIFETLNNENCPSLAGKPKIILLQACRNNPYETGCSGFDDGVPITVIQDVPMADSKDASNKDDCNDCIPTIVPEVRKVEERMEAERLNVQALHIPPEFIIVHPTITGMYAHRRTNESMPEKAGSWYITELTNVIKKHNIHEAPMNFLHVISATSGVICRDYETKTRIKKTSGKKNAVCLVHTLTKPLVFSAISVIEPNFPTPAFCFKKL